MDNTELQIQLANTYHQREVQDLQAAGLNPILSAYSSSTVPNIMNGGDSIDSSSGSKKSVSGKQALALAKANPQYKALDVAERALSTVNTAISGPFNWLSTSNNPPVNSAMSAISASRPSNTSPSNNSNGTTNNYPQGFYNGLGTRNQILANMSGSSWKGLSRNQQNAILRIASSFFPQLKPIIPVNSAVYNLTH